MDPDNDATNQGAADDAVHVNAEAGVDNTDDQNLEPIDGGLDPDADPDNQDPPADDFEEIDYEGHKVRGPKGIGAALMRHADYTRKTQEVAEQRRLAEADRQAAAAERAKAGEPDADLINEHAKVLLIGEQLADLDRTDWDGWELRVQQLRATGRYDEAQADADALARDWRRYQRLTQAKQEAEAGLNAKREALKASKQEHTLAAERETENRIQQGYAKLPEIIPGWSPQLETEVTQFAISHGVTPQDLRLAVADPQNIKFLHLAMLGERSLKTQAAADKLQRDQKTQPATQVGGRALNARRTTDSSGDGLSTAEWMRREQEREAAKRRGR